MKRPFSKTLLGIIIVASLTFSVEGNVYNTFYSQASPISAQTPQVILQQGTAGTSTIYTNSTSARVTVGSEGNSTYDYVLKIVNQVMDDWKVNLKVYSSSNISRILTTTISFHDGSTSDQIIVSGGIITQSEGSQYDLTGSGTIKISMSSVQASTSGTSYIYVYLKVLVPNTSTYSLFIIIFVIT